MKQTFGKGYPAFYHSILLCFILSIAIVTNIIKHILLGFAFASILLFAFALLFQ